jgi:hypothetical protein
MSTQTADTPDGFPLTREAWRDFVEQRRRTENALLERIKELNCLYGITRLAQRTEQPLDELLTDIAALIPASWQYPDIACACIRLGEGRYGSPNFRPTPWRQSSPIVIHGEGCGEVEVCYLEERPDCDEGPFCARSAASSTPWRPGRPHRGPAPGEERMRALSQELIMARRTNASASPANCTTTSPRTSSLAKADWSASTAPWPPTAPAAPRRRPSPSA